MFKMGKAPLFDTVFAVHKITTNRKYQYLVIRGATEIISSIFIPRLPKSINNSTTIIKIHENR